MTQQVITSNFSACQADLEDLTSDLDDRDVILDL